MTAALFDAQIREGWVEMECTKLMGLREQCLVDHIPFETYLRTAITTSPLASALQTAYQSLCSYPFSTTLRIAHLPLYIQLPLPPPPADVDWAWFENPDHAKMQGEGAGWDGYDWDEMDEATFAHGANGGEEGVGGAEGGEGVAAGEWSWMRIQPWKALLIVPDESIEGGGKVGDRSQQNQDQPFSDLWEEGEEEVGELVGRAKQRMREASARESVEISVGGGRARRRSREVSGQTMVGEGGGPLDGFDGLGVGGGGGEANDLLEEEKSALYRMFVEACKPSRR
jgi:hypothetical protein